MPKTPFPEKRFIVPPGLKPLIYERRQDILYYLAHKHPDLLATLEPWEVTVLLAHNWPGNVREVEKIGRLLMNKRATQTQDVSTEISEHGFNLLESDIFALPAANAHIFNAELKTTGLCVIGSKVAS